MANKWGADRQSASVQAAEDEYLLSLGDIVRVIWRRSLLIALVTVCLVGGAVGWTLTQSPRYEASLIMLVRQPIGVDPASIDDNAAGLDQLSVTLTNLIETRSIAETVIQRLDLQISTFDFLDNLTAEHTNGTQIIAVRYRDSSPEQAKRVVTTVGDAFSERVSEVSPGDSGVTVTVWQEAVAPKEPVSPDFKLNVALALLMGVTLGVVLAFLLENVDNSRRALKETEQRSPKTLKQI